MVMCWAFKLHPLPICVGAKWYILSRAITYANTAALGVSQLLSPQAALSTACFPYVKALVEACGCVWKGNGQTKFPLKQWWLLLTVPWGITVSSATGPALFLCSSPSHSSSNSALQHQGTAQFSLGYASKQPVSSSAFLILLVVLLLYKITSFSVMGVTDAAAPDTCRCDGNWNSRAKAPNQSSKAFCKRSPDLPHCIQLHSSCVKPQQQSWGTSALGSRIYCTEQSWNSWWVCRITSPLTFSASAQHGRNELSSFSLVAGAIHCHAALVSSVEHRAACGVPAAHLAMQCQPGTGLQQTVLPRAQRAQKWAVDATNLHVYEILHYWTALLHLDLCHSPVLGTFWF